MKKELERNRPAKLVLNRETLGNLEETRLKEIAGGISRSLCIPCPD